MNVKTDEGIKKNHLTESVGRVNLAKSLTNIRPKTLIFKIIIQVNYNKSFTKWRKMAKGKP